MVANGKRRFNFQKLCGQVFLCWYQAFSLTPPNISLISKNKSLFNSFPNNPKIVVCKLFHLEESKICRLGKGLSHILLSASAFNSDRTKLFPNQQILDSSKLKVCTSQFQILWKWWKEIEERIEITGKRRNCSVEAISPFPTVFSKGLHCRHVKTRACLGMG